MLDERMTELVTAAAEAVTEKKGFALKVLDVSELTAMAEAFVLASGASAPQLDAIVDEVRRRLRELGRTPRGTEGEAADGWMLVDYGDLVVHVFSEERRAFYSLEKLWSDGEDLTARVAAGA